MKKVIVGVGLGLATVSQAQAWTGGIEDMRTMEANQHGQVVRVKSSRVECCRLRPVREHGHAHQVKRIYNGQTYYCTDATGHHAKSRHVAPQRNHQHALQAQRAKRQAMYAAQAKRKALLLAQQRKRAALIAQQKRRAVQLAQQQRRAARQAQILAQKKRRAALLIQQKRRAMQLAQQQRQLAKRRALLAQQKQRVVHHQRPVQKYVAQEVVIERYTYPTYVTRSTQPAPAPMIRRAPRISASQSVTQQSVDYHDRKHARAGWQQRGAVHHVQSYPRPVVHHHRPVRRSAPVVHHDARLRQQRLSQVRSAQIAAQKHRQYQMQKQIRMAPVAPYVAPNPNRAASQPVVRNHSGGWQRRSAVQSHGMGNMYGRYRG